MPTSISIAASIRELVRQAYLTGAKILLRPLIERTAVVDYIVNQPDGPDLWARGWERGKRPHLRTLLTLMSGQDGADDEIIKSIIDDFHSVVHAEPAGSCKFLAPSPDGTLAYSARRMLHSDDMMTEISSASAMALIFLQSNAQRAFRDRVVSYAKELENEAQKGRH
ncbi:MAG TPA: hypothetical protein VFW19_12385 [Allosphingosinicella sp.]|nr:hypothetical protein [Allosphingosinicella sp.]